MNITYPRISLFNPKAKELEIVNGDDLNVEKLLKHIGAGGTQTIRLQATSNRPEILRRQRAFRFLRDNPGFSGWVQSRSMYSAEIPKDPQLFLDEFNSNTELGSRFLDKLNEGLKLLKKAKDVPGELAELRDFIGDTICRMSALETDMSSRVASKIIGASEFWGSATIVASADNYSDKDRELEAQVDKAIGYRRYAYMPLRKKRWRNVPRCLSFPIVRGIAKLAILFQNEWVDRIVYGPMVLSMGELPTERVGNLIKQQLLKVLPDNWEETAHAACGKRDVRFKVYFEYKDNKLRMQLLDLAVIDKGRRVEDDGIKKLLESKGRLPEIPDTFEGYSIMEVWRISSLSSDLQSMSVKRGFFNVTRAKLFAAFFGEKAARKFFEGGVVIEDAELTRRFGNEAIRGIFSRKHEPELYAQYKAANKYRLWLYAHLAVLADMAGAINAMKKRSEDWGIPLNFPDILGHDRHEVVISDTHPVSLIGRKNADGKSLEASDLRPITGLPKLNGGLVGLTGQNAGGKTVALEELANNIFLAQTGLPIFGRHFALNPKRAIALVFAERGEGSFAQLLIRKLERSLEAAKRYKPHQVIVVVDELGSGTQEVGGSMLGKRVLTALQNLGCTVVFVTQITDVASYATDNLGANVFQLDSGHQILPGIGKGNVELIMDEEGLSEHLPAPDQVLS